MGYIKIQGIRSNKFLPRAIQFWQTIYKLRVNAWRYMTGQPLLPNLRSCNHWSIILQNGMEYEAIGKGVIKHPRDIQEHQYVVEWVIPALFNKYKIEQFLDSQVGKGYQFSNFIFHMIYALTGWWLSPKFGNRWYCVELCCEVMAWLYTDIEVHHNPYQFQYILDSITEGKVIKDDEKLTFK